MITYLSPISELLEAVEELERLARRELVRVDLAELLAQWVSGRLGLRRLGGGEEIRRIAARDGGLLQQLEVFARPGNHRLRHAGQRRNLQPVALAGRPFFDRMQ